MKIKTQWIANGILLSGLAGFAPAQTPPAEPRVFTKHIQMGGVAGAEGGFQFISAGMEHPGKIVKGAPYSAEEVTETTQTLADGNRISHKITSQVYRDAEGRTRTERTMDGIGPWTSAGEPVTTVFINDPVSGKHYVLEPRSHTAHAMAIHGPGMAGPEMQDTIFAAAPVPAASAGIGPVIISGPSKPRSGEARVEPLGKQTVEGIEAEGTRTVTEIPAGAIGNERPIQTVSERWYSPELQTWVLTKRTDPRIGETTFRLTNIRRGEPAPSLFEAPADYTVREGKAGKPIEYGVQTGPRK